MDGVHWPQGCILQCSCESSLPAVFYLLLEGVLLWVFTYAKWVCSGTPCIHQAVEAAIWFPLETWLCFSYIDDSYLQGDTYAHCLENIHATRNLLVSLGFSTNQDKSVLQPAQHIVFLGFVLDSLHMSICLSDKRKGVILDICKKLNSGASHKIRAVASAVGCLIVLFYHSMERCKNLALKSATGNFEKTMRLNL